VHLVDFTIGIYYDARTNEHKKGVSLHKVYFLYKYYASYSADFENNLFKYETAVYKIF
jgi:hypothetical protein